MQAVVTKLTSADGAFIPAPAASRSHDRSSSEHLLHLLCISLLAHLLRTSRSRSCPSHPLRYGEVYGQGEGCSATIRESLTFGCSATTPRLTSNATAFQVHPSQRVILHLRGAFNFHKDFHHHLSGFTKLCFNQALYPNFAVKDLSFGFLDQHIESSDSSSGEMKFLHNSGMKVSHSTDKSAGRGR